MTRAPFIVVTARGVGLAITLVLAAALGLIAGNLIQGRADTTFGYPQGWQGGAAVPTSITADSAFSLDAMAAVQAARGDAQRPDYVDFGIRHLVVDDAAAAPAVEHVDYLQQYLAGRVAVEYVDHLQQYLAGRDTRAAAEKGSPTSPTPR